MIPNSLTGMNYSVRSCIGNVEPHEAPGGNSIKMTNERELSIAKLLHHLHYLSYSRDLLNYD